MKLTLLGTGSPVPNPLRAGPSSHLQVGDRSILIDCGNGAVRRLVEAGHAVKDVDVVFLTHLHSDHTIDLGYLLIAGWIASRSKPPRVVGPIGTRLHIDKLLQLRDWDMSIRRLADRLPPEVLRVGVEEVEHGSVISIGELSATAVRVDHYPVEHAFGYRFDAPQGSVFISGDTAACDAVVEGARNVDVLLHEVSQVGKDEAQQKGLTPEQAAVYFAWRARYHTPPREAGRIAREAWAKRLVLNHLEPFADADAVRREAEEGFGGPVAVGEDLMEISL